MAINNPLNNAVGMGGVGLSQHLGAAIPAYGQQIITTPSFPPPPFAFPAPYDIYQQGIHATQVIGFVGDFRVRKLENGFLIEYTLVQNGNKKEYFAEGLREVGERITAICVQNALQGGKK